MSDRASVIQKVQIGVESTPGTPVAASKQLQGTSVETEPQANSQEFRPQGSKYLTIVAEQREWVQAAMRGYPSYGDMVYLLSSAMSAATVTQYMDGGTPTGGYKWAFDSNPFDQDTPKTFTVEQGGAVRAHRFANGIVRELGIKFNRQTVEMTGQMLGTRISDGITLTGSPTAVELQPMLASTFDVFIDATFAGLGTTKVGRLFDGTFNLQNRYGPLWIVDSSQTSFAGTIEVVPTLGMTFIVEADAAGMSYLTTLRAGTTVFVRIRALGPTIYNAGTYAVTPLTYSFTVDVAAKVGSIGRFSDQEGVYAIEFPFSGVYDSGWTKAFHAEVVNKTAAL